MNDVSRNSHEDLPRGPWNPLPPESMAEQIQRKRAEEAKSNASYGVTSYLAIIASIVGLIWYWLDSFWMAIGILNGAAILWIIGYLAWPRIKKYFSRKD
jgi:predicted histidine transporter YuiF (NhaC family)